MTIRQIQCLLLFLGYPLEPDGVPGPETKAAVKDFQAGFGLAEADGIPGSATQEALRKAVCQGWRRKKPDFWEEIHYFTREEPYIGCSCGKCGGFPVEPEETLMKLADRVRGHFAVPRIPTSTVRCKAHNTAVGGVANSRHLTGKAMDFQVQGKQAAEVLAYVKQQPELRYAYAVSSRVVHMDIE